MTFQEYEKIFREILTLCESMENNCKSGDFDSLDIQFDKMSNLYGQLDVPDDITQAQLNIIVDIKNKVQEKNNNIVRYMQENKERIREELNNLNTDNKLINAYKIPKGATKSSIFDQGL